MAVATAPAPSATLALPGPPGPVDAPSGAGASRVALLLAIAADLMLFGALLAAYFDVRAGATPWPPHHVKLEDYLGGVITITVAMSAFSVQWMLSAARRDDRRTALVAMLLTLGLGAAVVNAQTFEYGKVGFSTRTHVYGSLYHLLTGYYLANVVAAAVVLAVVGVRVAAGQYGSGRVDAVRGAAHLWQFTNLVWLTVFLVLYVVK
jgi:cytochrome c oxidase subunit 3